MAQMMGGMAGLGLKPRSRYYEFHGRRLYMLKPDRDERLNELEAGAVQQAELVLTLTRRGLEWRLVSKSYHKHLN